MKILALALLLAAGCVAGDLLIVDGDAGACAAEPDAGLPAGASCATDCDCAARSCNAEGRCTELVESFPCKVDADCDGEKCLAGTCK